MAIVHKSKMLSNLIVALYSDDESDPLLFTPKRKKPNNSSIFSSESDSDESATTSTSSTSKTEKYKLKSLPKAVCKTADDSVPLPDPFKLPKHYRPEVEAALKTGKMNKDTNSELTAVASHVYFQTLSI